MTAQGAFARLERVQRELLAARFVVERAQRDVGADPTVLVRSSPQVRPSYLRDCANNLDLTYLLRLFSEFETALRDFVAARRPSPRRTRMEILMERASMLARIPADVVRAAHAVREYRNAIVHDPARAAALTFPQCKSRLSRYLSYLPRRW